MLIDFSAATKPEKINVCAKIQGILAANFPKSVYTMTEQNKDSCLKFYNKLIHQFDGRGLVLDECVLLYKHVLIRSPHNAIGEFMQARNSPHDIEGNCIFVDFFVANLQGSLDTHPIRDVLFGNHRVEYYMLARRGEIIVLTKDELQARAARLENLKIF